MRWMNNSYRGDIAGPGAVPREGIAALSPVNGIPFTWNPGHERGVGSFTLPVTPDGLWVGSDTDHAGQRVPSEDRVLPCRRVASLRRRSSRMRCPNDLYNMDQTGVGALNRRSYDLTTLGSTSTVPLGVDWRNARGAFMFNGNLYYGMNDGWLYKRTFDGTTLEPLPGGSQRARGPAAEWVQHPRHDDSGPGVRSRDQLRHREHDGDVLRQRPDLLHGLEDRFRRQRTTTSSTIGTSTRRARSSARACSSRAPVAMA